jgi:D-mannonate dehydratase
MKHSNFDKVELQKLEISLRSNYATTKAKLNDFETVLNQAKEVKQNSMWKKMIIFLEPLILENI